MTQTTQRDDMDVYEVSLQRVKKLERKRAKLYRQELAAILAMRDHAGFAMVEGAVAGAMRPHPTGTRGDRWVGLDDVAAADLASGLALSFGQAASLIDVAMATRTRYVKSTAALGRGGMTERKLRILNDELTNCSDELARQIETVVLPFAGKDTPSRFTKRIRTEMMRADGAGAAERRKQAVADRFVSFNQGPDGTGILYAQHDGVVMKAMEDRLTAIAGTADPDDPRSQGQRVGGCDTCGRPVVGVATIEGLGPIDPELARRLAKDVRWLRIVTDPVTGVAIDAETPAYLFPAAMKHRIQARDRHCRFPGCTRSSSWCEVDHVIPHPVGPTSTANALLICKRHHRLKHHTRWRVETTPTGEATWTSPTGRSYYTKPPPAD